MQNSRRAFQDLLRMWSMKTDLCYESYKQLPCMWLIKDKIFLLFSWSQRAVEVLDIKASDMIINKIGHEIALP